VLRNKGSLKTQKNNSRKSMWAHHKKCGVYFVRRPPPPGCLVRFFLSRFWAFRNKGSSKTRLKKIARKSPQLPTPTPKKSSYLLTSLPPPSPAPPPRRPLAQKCFQLRASHHATRFHPATALYRSSPHDAMLLQLRQKLDSQIWGVASYFKGRQIKRKLKAPYIWQMATKWGR
jgi:hypothetical protein